MEIDTKQHEAIHHIDGNPHNNELKNLEIVQIQANRQSLPLTLDQDLHRRAAIAKRDPRRRFVWSTGEQLAVALILNKPGWLKAQGYTMLEAVERLGEEWMRAAIRTQKALDR